MNTWIVEDEAPAARRLAKLLAEADPGLKVTHTFATIAETMQALANEESPQLMLLDIHLADGSSFEIFRQATVPCPVIFTTAFDQYAIDAFKVNSVDYLLKPVKPEELKAALDKFARLHRKQAQQELNVEALLRSLQLQKKEYKQRFAIRYGEHLRTVDISQIAYFYTENKATFLATRDGANRFIIDYSMEELEEQLDPRYFFRINRQFIVHISAIAEMHSYTKARVMVSLQPPSKLDTIVSSERAAAFKKWLDDAV
jgi:DNA-binding LytR/AlgR family response regulator